jgi:hypothetical protein
MGLSVMAPIQSNSTNMSDSFYERPSIGLTG